MAQVKNVAEWLEATADRLPDKIAFSDGVSGLTFSELRKQARAIASEFARRGLFKQPVLLVLGMEPRAIAAFMGVAYSGNFYVPIDITMPTERVKNVTDKLKPAVTINAENYTIFAESAVDDALIAGAMARQIDTDLLYVLFTSGSTGMPKGVAVQHCGVIDYTDKVRETFGFDENTIHGQSVPLSFDSSILPVYQTLLNGGSDYFIPQKSLMFAAKTIDFLNEHRCNAIYGVPTKYAMIAKSGIFAKRKPEYLKKCLFVGEVMPNNVLNVWRAALPDAMFANLMGPTEITGTYLYYVVDREFADDEPLPIGKSYPNVQALLLNEHDEECQIGEVGELCVRGSKVSCGYYNDPEKTAAAFTQNPLNMSYPETIYRTGDLGYVNERGEIMFMGRKDFQIKHVGMRIELGEIEITAGIIDGVELCACVYDNDAKRIVLFYCGDAEISTIKEQLKKKLEPYMVPGRIERLPELPKTTSGKISRSELKGRLNDMA